MHPYLLRDRSIEILFALCMASAFVTYLFAYSISKDDLLLMAVQSVNMSLIPQLNLIFPVALMTVVMMGPALLPGATHVAANSFYWRKKRAVTYYCFSYLACWTVASWTTMAFIMNLRAFLTSYQIAGLFFAGASIWQISEAKRISLAKCHKSIPLVPRGFKADLSCIAFGSTNGWACLMSCWPFMSAIMALPQFLVFSMPISAVYVVAERRSDPNKNLLSKSGMIMAVVAVILVLPT